LPYYSIYFFLLKRKKIEYATEKFGHAFEHFIYMELIAHAHYSGKRYPIHYWCTSSQFEVDFVLGDHEVVIEVKSTNNVLPKHMKGLHAFNDEYKTKINIIVSTDPQPRQIGKVLILPWKIFLERLWGDEIV